MTKMLALIVGLVSFNTLANTTYTDVTEYTNRTASDYCGKSQECKVDFSQKLLYAYKDGEKDGASSRFKASTLIKRYHKKWQILECSVAEPKDKAACNSMVDRLVDSYTRGLAASD